MWSPPSDIVSFTLIVTLDFTKFSVTFLTFFLFGASRHPHYSCFSEDSFENLFHFVQTISSIDSMYSFHSYSDSKCSESKLFESKSSESKDSESKPCTKRLAPTDGDSGCILWICRWIKLLSQWFVGWGGWWFGYFCIINHSETDHLSISVPDRISIETDSDSMISQRVLSRVYWENCLNLWFSIFSWKRNRAKRILQKCKGEPLSPVVHPFNVGDHLSSKDQPAPIWMSVNVWHCSLYIYAPSW